MTYEPYGYLDDDELRRRAHAVAERLATLAAREPYAAELLQLNGMDTLIRVVLHAQDSA